MSLIAASQEDIDAGKHAALADLHFLLTLNDSIVTPAEKQTTKDQLLEGIKKNSRCFVIFFNPSFRTTRARQGELALASADSNPLLELDH